MCFCVDRWIVNNWNNQSHTNLIDSMNVCKTIKSGIHCVEHVDYLNGFAGCADVSEGDHITEKDGAHFEFT